MGVYGDHDSGEDEVSYCWKPVNSAHDLLHFSPEHVFRLTVICYGAAHHPGEEEDQRADEDDGSEGSGILVSGVYPL